jgi:hypothetical protein
LAPVTGDGTPTATGVRELAGRQQRALHLGRVDVHAAADDEVDGPPADRQVALVVHPAEVAGAQPAVGHAEPAAPPQ